MSTDDLGPYASDTIVVYRPTMRRGVYMARTGRISTPFKGEKATKLGGPPAAFPLLIVAGRIKARDGSSTTPFRLLRTRPYPDPRGGGRRARLVDKVLRASRSHRGRTFKVSFLMAHLLPFLQGRREDSPRAGLSVLAR